MSDAPERIWAWKHTYDVGPYHTKTSHNWLNADVVKVAEKDGAKLYVRADLHEADMDEMKRQNAQAFSSGWGAATEAQTRRIEDLEAALKSFVEAFDASKWRKVMGENLKRILVAPTAIDRARAALSKGTEGE